MPRNDSDTYTMVMTEVEADLLEDALRFYMEHLKEAPLMTTDLVESELSFAAPLLETLSNRR